MSTKFIHEYFILINFDSYVLMYFNSW